MVCALARRSQVRYEGSPPILPPLVSTVHTYTKVWYISVELYVCRRRSYLTRMQFKLIWALRENITEAQRHEGVVYKVVTAETKATCAEIGSLLHTLLIFWIYTLSFSIICPARGEWQWRGIFMSSLLSLAHQALALHLLTETGEKWLAQLPYICAFSDCCDFLLSLQYDVSLPLTNYYQLVEDMRERCTSVTRWTMGYGHVGDGKTLATLNPLMYKIGTSMGTTIPSRSFGESSWITLDNVHLAY